MFSIPEPQSRKCLQGEHRVHIVSFLFFQGLESYIICCAKSETIFICFVQFFTTRGIVLVILSCSEAEEYMRDFYYKINFFNRIRSIQISYLFLCQF